MTRDDYQWVARLGRMTASKLGHEHMAEVIGHQTAIRAAEALDWGAGRPTARCITRMAYYEAIDEIRRRCGREDPRSALSRDDGERVDPELRRMWRRTPLSLISLFEPDAMDQLGESSTPSQHDVALWNERREWLRDRIAELSPREQQMFKLHFQGNSHVEIGRQIGVCDARVCQVLKTNERVFRSIIERDNMTEGAA